MSLMLLTYPHLDPEDVIDTVMTTLTEGVKELVPDLEIDDDLGFEFNGSGTKNDFFTHLDMDDEFPLRFVFIYSEEEQGFILTFENDGETITRVHMDIWDDTPDVVSKVLHTFWNAFPGHLWVEEPDVLPPHIVRQMWDMSQQIGKKYECVVCMEEMTEETFSISKCGHEICEDCMDNLRDSRPFAKRPKCPVCRTIW